MEGFESKKLFNSILPVILVLSSLSPISTLAAVEIEAEGRGDQQIAAAIEEQMKLEARGERLHEDLQGISGDEEVAVIVHLTQKPVALEEGIQAAKEQNLSQQQAIDLQAKVEAQQIQVKEQLAENNVTIEETHSYSTVLNGFSASISGDDLTKMLEVPTIRFIEPDRMVQVSKEATPPTAMPVAINGPVSTPTFLGVDKLWAQGYEGQGVKVAVLDTGIDSDHPEFKGIYKGGKNFVKHSFRYKEPRADNDPSETRPSERPENVPEFNGQRYPYATSHGTEAAGAIAAIGDNKFGFKGLAPKVDLYAYRVIGAYGVGRESWVLAGIEEAAEQNMDVINFSFGFVIASESDSMTYAINNATLAGTTAVLAGGNGPFRSTIETPATSRLGITVGSTTLPEEKYSGTINAKIGNFTLTRTANLMATTLGENATEQLTGEYELIAIPEAGRSNDYEGIDVMGKVVLVGIGRTEPEEKIRVAKERGAVAIFLHNVKNQENAPEPSGYYLGESLDFIPAFDLSQADGEVLRQYLKEAKGTTIVEAFKKTVTKGDEVDEYSGRGPTYPNYDIKPDVLAPGVRILTTEAMYKTDFPNADYSKAYKQATGDFIASAHVTGIVALLKQAHPDWTPFEIKVALSNTAKRLDKKKYDVFAQGAGRVQAFAAASPEVLAYTQDQAVLNETGVLVDNPKGTVTFGIHSLKEKNLSVSRKILVKDLAGLGGEFKATVEITKPFGDAKVTVDKPVFTLSGEQEITVKLTASKMEEVDLEAEVLGYIHLTKGDMTTSLPFAAGLSISEYIEIEQVDISESDLSPNGDGIKDKGELNFSTTGDLINFDIVLVDLNGQFSEGQVIFDEVGYLFEDLVLKKGRHDFQIDGTYKPWNGDPRTTIPDGLYGLQFLGRDVEEEDEDIIASYNFVMPFIVKTSKPLVSGSVSQGVATGKVTDKYLEYNEDLRGYDLDYDLNEKLHATYITTKAGEDSVPVPFTLEQDGSFSVPVAEDEEIEEITVVVIDAAGNKGEAVIYQK